ncbi:MAG: radical SAM protein [Bacilli bacterium]|nr:radical SAM protein [Bacilli bacterium]
MKKIKIKRFFECLIPMTVCNLKCSYCYVNSRNYRNMKLAEMKYTSEYIGKCLTKERLGGVCYFSICGAGETLAQPEIIDIAMELLKNGHVVNITTNGTLTHKFRKFQSFFEEDLKRLHFSFSFHYLELKRLKLLDIFFNNIAYVKSLGCSFVLQLNLCDEYIPYIEEIKKISLEKVGAYPQIAATRDEREEQIKILTSHSIDDYIKFGKSFDSPLFDYTMKNFNKKRTEFCYAGERAGVLNLVTGELKKCYGHSKSQKIFENPNKKIDFSPIGNNCRTCFCMNSSHFMSLGVIDDVDEDITYVKLRDREDAKWFNETTRKALGTKLNLINRKYTEKEKKVVNIKEGKIIKVEETKKTIKKIAKKFIKENSKNGPSI